MVMLKIVHVTTVLLSFILFTVRAYSVLTRSMWHQNHFFRVVPHLNDTILFISALGLVFVLKQYPFIEPWLTVKVILLLVYIVLGMAFMRLAKSQMQRVSLFVLAVLCFVYIVGVAGTHQPLGMFAQFVH